MNQKSGQVMSPLNLDDDKRAIAAFRSSVTERSNEIAFHFETKQDIIDKYPLSGSNQSEEKQIRHSIKTVASKQMPKCFKVSKNSTPSANQVIKVFRPGPNGYKVEAYYGKNIQTQKSNNANDARVSFNDYSFISANKQNNQSANKPKATCFPYKLDEKPLSLFGRQITERSQDEERERMTPAFNARQSYIKNDSFK